MTQVTTWALQVQFLLQIIINRISILLIDQGKALRLKIGVAVLITAVNISVYCIWVPARMQISDRYVHINDIWDRIEKGIYLCVDAVLNYYFIRTVQKQLVEEGCKQFSEFILRLLVLGLLVRRTTPTPPFAMFPLSHI